MGRVALGKDSVVAGEKNVDYYPGDNLVREGKGQRCDVKGRHDKVSN